MESTGMSMDALRRGLPASTPRLVRRSVRICHVRIGDSGAGWR